ncbi:hypothetical protein [Nocardia sp. NBC_01388]|uniref:hypothetical protein n=1 Tax=Nocardia sp. NBC_01388 TaxID=2903596 RepID=UPI00386E8628
MSLRVRRWNSNHNGAAPGWSLFAMTDPFFGMMAYGQLGAGYRVWNARGRLPRPFPVRRRYMRKWHRVTHNFPSHLRESTDGRGIFLVPVDNWPNVGICRKWVHCSRGEVILTNKGEHVQTTSG